MNPTPSAPSDDAPVSIARMGRVMGCAFEIVVVASDDAALDDVVHLLDRAEAHLHRLEGLWSRFLPTSDVCRLNRAGGGAVIVDEATIDLVVHMVQGHRATEGAFDPTLLAALVDLGYDVSRDDPGLASEVPEGVGRSSDLDAVAVDLDAGTVQMPRLLVLDAGGIGKGLAADRVVADLLDHGAAGALVGVGGDVRVSGAAPQAGGWAIGLDDPLGRPSTIQVRLVDGGVASSGTDRRRWLDRHGRPVHHLLDPRTHTCLPDDGARSRIGATVVAGTGAWSDVWTKALMVRGEEAFAGLDAVGLAGRIVFADGTSVTSDRWSDVAVDRHPTSTGIRPTGDRRALRWRFSPLSAS